ncbi:MAG: FtsX-like permease family protein [Erysipelotrichaceae bacterium]|nr:FtsX-like permease family protein [Erysipelotrichaceae bacterium]
MIFEYIKLSINELFNNKLRTFLSLIGIVIGVAVVFTILSINDIANAAISSAITGTNGTVNINYTSDKSDEESNLYTSFASSFGGIGEVNYRFDPDDTAELIKIDGISDALPHYSSSINVSLDRKNITMNIKRDSENFIDFYNLELVKGKYIRDYPEDKRMSIAVVSDKFIENSMKLTIDEALGKTIKLNNKLFTIVGVSSSNNSNIDNIILLYDKAYDTMFSSGSIQFMSIKIDPGYDLNDTTALAVDKMNELHNTTNTKDGYIQEDLSLIISQITSVTNILSIVMSIIASISLLIAGIGVMNIMLVSVVERTKEIGVKRAIGASKGAISFQFIIESSLLTLLGGVIGIIFGITVIKLALNLLDMNLPINISYVFFAVIFSISLGIIFGFLPAKRAANLNIIEAIQSE